MKYDVALIEKDGNKGLQLKEIQLLYGFCSETFNNGRDEVFPVEIEAREHESTAIGFITPAAYDKLDWDIESSGLHAFVSSIMDDMELEDELAIDSYILDGVTYRIYEYKGLKLWFNR